MDESLTRKFTILVGKKEPKEYQQAVSEGFYEVFRTAVPGGYEITMAKLTLGLVNGTKRKALFIIDAEPPKETMVGEMTDATFTLPKEGTTLNGKYGNCGRMFLLVGGEKGQAATKRKAR